MVYPVQTNDNHHLQYPLAAGGFDVEDKGRQTQQEKKKMLLKTKRKNAMS